MIKTIRDLYTEDLKNRKGEILKASDLDLGFSFFGVKDANLVVVNHLVQSNKMKMYFGIQTNASIVPDVVEKVGEVGVFNELKYEGATMDMQKFYKELEEEFKDKLDSGEMTDEDVKEEFNKRAKEVIEDHKKEVENTNQKVALKVHRDEFILLPSDVNMGDYQRVLNAIKELGHSPYDELVFLEIL